MLKAVLRSTSVLSRTSLMMDSSARPGSPTRTAAASTLNIQRSLLQELRDMFVEKLQIRGAGASSGRVSP
jgi:hypothetical protein